VPKPGITLTRINKKTITIDGNNPLCGREMIFRLEITAIHDAADDELDTS